MIDAESNCPIIPSSWCWSNLDAIISFIGSGITPKGGKTVYQSSGIPFIRSQNVYPGNLRLEDVAFIDFNLHESMSRTHLQPKDVLLNITGASIGRSAVVPPFLKEGNVNQHVCILRLLPQIDSDYICWFLNSTLGQNQIMDSQSGVTRQGLNYKQARVLQIPLAPLPEQHRIVARIEELFSRLDTGVAALQKAKAQLKRYRQAVLKAAVEGKLTEEWRKAHPDVEPAEEILEKIKRDRTAYQMKIGSKKKTNAKCRTILQNGKSDIIDLPQGWACCQLDAVSEIRLGRQRSPSRAIGPNMRPYLRAANTTWNGLDLSDVKQMDFTPDELEVYRLKKGDILLAEASGSASEVGKPSIWNEEINDCCFQNTLIRVRSLGPLPSYLYIHFLYDALSERFGRTAKGVGIHHLGAEGLSNWMICIPPLKEQYYIVDKTEKLLLSEKEVNATIDSNLRYSRHLRQAILKRAFEGRLVPQDPNDEPASVLLDRIKYEKAIQAPKRGKRINDKMTHQMRLPQ